MSGADPNAGMLLMPPAKHKCQTCAVQHDEAAPHDATSLFYQTKFQMENGRPGTWRDAYAHCDTALQAAWREALMAKGIDVDGGAVFPGQKPPAGLDRDSRYGETPVPANALLQPGEELTVSDDTGAAVAGKVLAVVPPGVGIDHAIADQNGRMRPAMTRVIPARQNLYVLQVGDRERIVKHAELQRGLKRGKAADEARAAAGTAP